MQRKKKGLQDLNPPSPTSSPSIPAREKSKLNVEKAKKKVVVLDEPAHIHHGEYN
jgi:hypothetical protein